MPLFRNVSPYIETLIKIIGRNWLVKTIDKRQFEFYLNMLLLNISVSFVLKAKFLYKTLYYYISNNLHKMQYKFYVNII